MYPGNKNQSSMVNQVNNKSSTAQSPHPEYKRERRESLVKPTWPNVSPGQVSPAALAALDSGLVNGGGLTEVDSLTLVNNQNNSGTKVTSQRREVELYDLFCKVNISFCLYLFCMLFMENVSKIETLICKHSVKIC